jgi:hypothetical protein
MGHDSHWDGRALDHPGRQHPQPDPVRPVHQPGAHRPPPAPVRVADRR